MLFLRLDDSHLTLFYKRPGEKTEFSEELSERFPFEHRKLRPSTSLEMNLREIRASHIEFQEKQRMEVLVTSPVTLVPISEFEEEMCEDFYHFSVVGERREHVALRVFYDMLPFSNAVLIFALEENVCQAIEDEFGEEVHYVSALTNVLKSFSEKIHPQHRRRVYLHCCDARLDVIVYEGYQLLLLNSFEIRGHSDVTYYALNVAQNLGLELTQTPFTLCGTEEKCQAVSGELERFVKNVGLLRASAVFNRHPLATIPNAPFDLVNHILTK